MPTANKIFDAMLVLEYQAGNAQAMSLLVKRWHKKLVRHSYWYLKDQESAKDVVQDCWGIIVRKVYGLNDANCFGSWAMSIVTRRSIDRLRKRNKEEINKSEYNDQYGNIYIDDSLDAFEAPLAQLRRLVNTLPDSQRLVLDLFYLEEFSIKQIASVLNLPTGTVKSRLFNAREKLKQHLKSKES